MQTYDIDATFVHMPDARVCTAYYGNGSLAVLLIDDEGPETISVNLQDYGLDPVGKTFYVRNYGQHEGLAEELVRAGIAETIGSVIFGPYDSTATYMQLLVEPEES